jgi:hypothetical protein
MSNFLEAPNGGGAGGNQQPASPSSLRERCDSRGNNKHAAAKDSRAVSLRSRELLAEPIVLGPTCNIALRSQAYRITQIYEPVTNRCDLPDQPTAVTTAPPWAIPTVGYCKEDPPFAAGESREETTN